MPDLTRDEMKYIKHILCLEKDRLDSALISLENSAIYQGDPVYVMLIGYQKAIDKMMTCINNLDERK